MSFTTPPRLQEGELHRGELKLSGAPDPLEFDDKRYFTFKVRPPLKVLLISDQAIDAEFVAAALDPDAPRRTQAVPGGQGQARRVRRQLPRHAARVMPRSSCSTWKQLDEDSWGLLNGYVHEGGGPGRRPGRPLPRRELQRADRQPASAGPASRSRTPPSRRRTFGKIADVTHPLFQRYAKELEAQLALSPGLPLLGRQAAGGLARPAELLRRRPGAARAHVQGAQDRPRLALDDAAGSPRQRGPTAAHGTSFPCRRRTGSFLALMNQTVPYLAGTSNEQLNFEAGENVAADPRPRRPIPELPGHRPRPEDHRVAHPLAQQRGPADHRPPDARPVDGDGQGRRRQRQTKLGFSVNPPRAESQFEPAASRATSTRSSARTATRWPRTPTHSRTLENTVRVGHEIFPWLMFLILIIVTLENFLANTFYKESAPAGSRPARRPERRSNPDLSSPAGVSTMIQGISVSSEPDRALVGCWRLRPRSWSCSRSGPTPGSSEGRPAAGGGWRWACGCWPCCSACWRPCGLRSSSRRRRSRPRRWSSWSIRSTSMIIGDEVSGQTRWDVAQKTIEQAIETAKTLGPNLEVKTYRFDTTLSEPKADEKAAPEPAGPGDRARHRDARGREARRHRTTSGSPGW